MSVRWECRTVAIKQRPATAQRAPHQHKRTDRPGASYESQGRSFGGQRRSRCKGPDPTPGTISRTQSELLCRLLQHCACVGMRHATMPQRGGPPDPFSRVPKVASNGAKLDPGGACEWRPRKSLSSAALDDAKPLIIQPKNERRRRIHHQPRCIRNLPARPAPKRTV